MTDAENGRLADRLALRELNDAFAYGLDSGDVDFFLSIFTADANYRNGQRLLSGRAEMDTFFRARAVSGRVSRHFYSGLRLIFAGDMDAAGRSNWVTFAGEGPLPLEGTLPFVVSDVSDVYRKQPDGSWLIAERQIDAAFVNKAIAPLAASLGRKP